MVVEHLTYIVDAVMIGNTGGGREPLVLYGSISLIDIAAVGPPMPKSGDGCASKAQGAPPSHCYTCSTAQGFVPAEQELGNSHCLIYAVGKPDVGRSGEMETKG